MNKTQAGRLLTLAWYLRTEVKPEKFDMEFIGRADYPEEFSGRFDEHPCGTSACALGYASNIWPERFPLISDEWEEHVILYLRDGVDYDDVIVQEFFGINLDEAENLFGPNKATPKQKAAQIEKLVGDHGWEYADAH